MTPGSPSLLEQALDTDSICRIGEVVRIVGCSRASIYSWMREGHFPKPRKLGPRAVGWLASEIHDWIASRETT